MDPNSSTPDEFRKDLNNARDRTDASFKKDASVRNRRRPSGLAASTVRAAPQHEGAENTADAPPAMPGASAYSTADAPACRSAGG